MKPTTIALLLLPIATLATPITNPNLANTLMPRDKVCYLNKDALKNDPQGCDTTPFSGITVKKVTGGDRFGVRCTAKGKPWGSKSYTKWDYVPGWNCWIWAGWTQEGCESGLAYHEDYKKCL